MLVGSGTGSGPHHGESRSTPRVEVELSFLFQTRVRSALWLLLLVLDLLTSAFFFIKTGLFLLDELLLMPLYPELLSGCCRSFVGSFMLLSKNAQFPTFWRLKDGTYYCYCAYVLRISRYSDFLLPMLTNTGIFLRGLK